MNNCMPNAGFWLIVAVLMPLDFVIHSLTIALGPVPLCLDAGEYWEMGASVAGGDIFLMNMPIAYRTPVYAWFIGAIRSLFGESSLLAMVIAQHGLVIGTSLISGAILWVLFRSRLAFVLGYGLSMLGVTRAWHANIVLSETLFTFAFTLFLLAIALYLRRPTLCRSILLAVALGAAILVRPVPQLLGIPLLLVILLNSLGHSGQLKFHVACWHSLIVAGVLAVVLSPWYFRNQALFGSWFLTRLPIENKWQVCFHSGSGANLPLPRIAATERFLSALHSCGCDDNDRYSYAVVAKLRRAGLNEVEIDQLLTEMCLAAIREHPIKFGYAWLKRFGNFWRCTVDEFPSYGRKAAPFFDDQFVWRSQFAEHTFEPVLKYTAARSLRLNELMLICVATGCGLMLLNSAIRMFALSLALTFAYFAAVTSALEMENYRYRMVLEPAMIVACVGGIFTYRQLRARPEPSQMREMRKERSKDEDSSGFDANGEYGTPEWEANSAADSSVFELSNRL